MAGGTGASYARDILHACAQSLPSLPGSGSPSSATTRSCTARSAPAASPTPTTRRAVAPSGFIEDFVRDEVLPRYANTHSESSGTGLQTTRLREDARAIIHAAVQGHDDTVVIFTGTGSTAAINKIIGILGLRIPADLDREYGLSAQIPADRRPVVFIGPYEHHSNELPWRESIADVVTIPEDRRRSRRPRTPHGRARALRRAPAQDRIVQRREQRHRHPDRHRPHHRPAARARRPRLLGLRRGSSVRRHRRVERGRRLPLPAQVHRRSRHARRARRQPAAAHQLGARRGRRRNGRVRQSARAPLHRRPGPSRRGGHAGASSSRSGPVWSSRSRTRSASRRSASSSAASSTAPARAGRRIPRSRSSAARPPIVSRSSRSSSRARAAATCTTTSSSRSSTISSASRRAADARARARTATACSASTSSARTSSSARSRAVARASSPAGCA